MLTTNEKDFVMASHFVALDPTEFNNKEISNGLKGLTKAAMKAPDVFGFHIIPQEDWAVEAIEAFPAGYFGISDGEEAASFKRMFWEKVPLLPYIPHWDFLFDCGGNCYPEDRARLPELLNPPSTEEEFLTKVSTYQKKFPQGKFPYGGHERV